MRIVGSIEHPFLKISIFKNDDRFSLKLESGNYEQIYKFRAGEGIASVEDVEKFTTSEFLLQAEDLMKQQHAIRTTALSKLLPPVEEDEFDKII